MNLEKDKTIQIESVDDDLRNKLWNHIRYSYFTPQTPDNYFIVYNGFFKEIFEYNIHANIYIFRDKFLALQWYKIYDFIEFILSNCRHSNTSDPTRDFNQILEEESAGYRIIDGSVTPITTKTEISEIEGALSAKIPSVASHIKTSLELFSDRKDPDPENSIKESISALEAFLRKAAGNDDLDLRRALKSIMKDSTTIDQNLRNAILNLYTFTNDSSGVRHSHADTKIKVTLDDARFVLIICSAIINYLTTKK